MRLLAIVLCLGLAAAHPQPFEPSGSPEDPDIDHMMYLLGEGGLAESSSLVGSSSSSSQLTHVETSESSYFISTGGDSIKEITVAEAAANGLTCMPAGALSQSADSIVQESVDETATTAASTSEGAASSSAAAGDAATSASAGSVGAASSSAASGDTASSSAAAGDAASSSAASGDATSSSAAAGEAASSSAASGDAASSSAASGDAVSSSAASGDAASSSAASGDAASSSAAAGDAASSSAASDGASSASAAAGDAASSSAAAGDAASSSAASGDAASSSAASGDAASSSSASGDAASSAAASGDAASSSAAADEAASSSAAAGDAASSSAASGGAASSSAASGDTASSSAASGDAASSSAAAGDAVSSSAAAGDAASSSAASGDAASSSAASGDAASSSAASGEAASSSAAAGDAASSSAAAGDAASSSAAGGGAASSASSASESSSSSSQLGYEIEEGEEGYVSEEVEPVGECVPYYLCKDGDIVTDGDGIIDIRFGSDVEDSKSSSQCPNFLDVLCLSPLSEPDPDILGELTEYEYEPSCGHRNPEGVSIIFDGFKEGESQFGEFPWMGIVLEDELLDYDQVIQRYVCGASLIHPQVIMTGAHCINGKDATKLTVRLGDWDTENEKEIFPHEQHRVASMEVHERFNNKNLRYDVGLLFLEEPVELKQHIDTLCLPEVNEDFDYTSCVATGFGKDQFHGGRFQNIMKQVDLPVVPHRTCQTQLRKTRLGRGFRLHRTFTCAGGEAGTDTCRGDGGSPLACPSKEDPNKYVQVGIVAWGIGCGEDGVPGVYASVPKLVNWVNQKMAAHGYGPKTPEYPSSAKAAPPV